MKNSLKRTFIFVVFLFFSAQLYANKKNEYKHLDDILHSFFREVKEELDLSWGGNRGPSVEEISVNLYAYRRANLEEARDLIIYVTEKLVHAINSHEKLRSFLDKYPFPTNRVNIRIDFKNPLSCLFADGSIASVSHTFDHLFYYEKEVFVFLSKDIHEELYEEAKKISFASMKGQLPQHQETEFDNALDEIYLAFDEQMHRRYNACRDRIGCKRGDYLDKFEVIYRVFQRSDLKKAREVQVYATETLLNAINTNERIKPFLKKYPFTADDIKMRLEFRKDDPWIGPRSYTDGTIESVMLENGELSYFKEEWEGETTDVVPAGTELYQEALRLVGKPNQVLVYLRNNFQYGEYTRYFEKKHFEHNSNSQKVIQRLRRECSSFLKTLTLFSPFAISLIIP